MTIVSKPTTREYSDGWDRIFKPVKWGVVVGKPTSLHPQKNSSWVKENIGKWCLDVDSKLKLFDKRSEAIKEAKRQASLVPYWTYHAKKYQ